MTKVTFYKPEKVEDINMKFAVIAARYQDKWVYCSFREFIKQQDVIMLIGWKK